MTSSSGDFQKALAAWSAAHRKLVENELLFADLLVTMPAPERIAVAREALQQDRDEVNRMLEEAMKLLPKRTA